MAVNQFVEISPEIHKNLSGIAISVRINYDWNTFRQCTCCHFELSNAEFGVDLRMLCSVAVCNCVRINKTLK